MDLSITGATGFFGSQVTQERDGRDIRVKPVTPEQSDDYRKVMTDSASCNRMKISALRGSPVAQR
jgi:NAD dependent epimerase/dehydratase family enzyme